MCIIVGSDTGGVICEGNRVVGGATEGRDSFEGVKISFHLSRTILYRLATSDISSTGSAGCCVVFVGCETVGSVVNFVFFSISFFCCRAASST